jgi:hypothetical protein
MRREKEEEEEKESRNATWTGVSMRLWGAEESWSSRLPGVRPELNAAGWGPASAS